MISKLKYLSLSTFFMLASLILFAGCSKDDDGAKPSAAYLFAETVNCNITTNHIATQGADGLVYVAVIVKQDDPAWCSFDSNAQLSDISGKVGTQINLYMERNLSNKDRTADILVTFSNKYTVTLTLTQTKFSVTADFDKAWAEQPLYKENSDYIYKTYYTNLSGYGYARNYSICYDTSKRVAHWVAYPLSTHYTLPSVSRTDAWSYDPNKQLPVISDNYQQYIIQSYGAGGYARGHQCPSADRYNNVATNEMTFYATNMMPQDYDFNGGIWAQLENSIRQSMKLLKKDTMYVVTGTYFGDSRTIRDRRGNTIAVPSNCWKVLLRTKTGKTGKPIQECTADELIGVGFWFKNESSSTGNLSPYVKSIAEIEALTGFTFFRNLPVDAVQTVKSQKSLRDWGFQ